MKVGEKKAAKEKNKKTEGKSANGKGKGRGSTLVVVLCSWRLDVLSRGNTSDFQSAPCCGAALPFEPKQTECSVFFAKWPGREREGGRNGLCFRFQLEDQGWMGVRETPRCNGGGRREREGADKRIERKKKRRESSRDHARVLRKKNFLRRFFFTLQGAMPFKFSLFKQ